MPCYNEGTRILPVISELKKANNIGEIIIVDDGSNLATKKILKQISGIILCTHKKNRGKSAAIQTGLKQTHYSYIALVDSDLIGFKSRHFDSLAYPVVTGNWDLSLSDRQNEPFYCRLCGFSVAYTGERVFKKKQLLKYQSEIFKNQGYLLEAAINRIYFSNYRVCRVYYDGVGQNYKLKKQGSIGLLNDIRMTLRIIKYLGLLGMFNQIYHAKRLPSVN